MLRLVCLLFVCVEGENFVFSLTGTCEKWSYLLLFSEMAGGFQCLFPQS